MTSKCLECGNEIGPVAHQCPVNSAPGSRSRHIQTRILRAPDWLKEAWIAFDEAEGDDAAWAAWASHWGPVLLEDLRQLYGLPTDFAKGTP